MVRRIAARPTVPPMIAPMVFEWEVEREDELEVLVGTEVVVEGNVPFWIKR
jgi:hypothetical protein